MTRRIAYGRALRGGLGADAGKRRGGGDASHEVTAVRIDGEDMMGFLDKKVLVAPP